MVVGAAIGKELRRPWLALPAAFASHFVLDRIPHLDWHGLFGISGKGPTTPEAVFGVVDFLAGIALVTWAVGRRPVRALMLLCAFLALLMDLLNHVPPFRGWIMSCPWTAPVVAFHGACEWNVSPAWWPIGFGTQAVLLGLCLWVIRRSPDKVL